MATRAEPGPGAFAALAPAFRRAYLAQRDGVEAGVRGAAMALDQGRGEAEARRKRLASALRENLKRRKAQQRGRSAAAAHADRPDEAAMAAPPPVSNNREM
jgi:hypothetical protein